MEDTTTTVAPLPEPSEDTSQLETAVETAAEVATDETQTDQSDSTSHDDDEDITWLQNKGIDPSDPKALSATAKLLRDNEREFHKTRQEAKNQLQEAATAAVPSDEYASDYEVLAQRQQVLETRVAVQDFYSDHPDARDMDADMAKIVQAKPYLAQDLDTVYALAKSTKYEAAISAAETKGRTDAKAAIARQSGAALPKGNASDSTPPSSLTRQAIADMSADEYMSRKDEINAAINSGRLT